MMFKRVRSAITGRFVKAGDPNTTVQETYYGRNVIWFDINDMESGIYRLTLGLDGKTEDFYFTIEQARKLEGELWELVPVPPISPIGQEYIK